MSSTLVFVIGTFSFIGVIAIISVILLIRNKVKTKIENNINNLESEKNSIISSSLITELKKSESLANTQTLKEKYKNWKKRFDEIELRDIPKVTDKILEVDNHLNVKNYKEVYYALANAEIEICYLKTKANYLLEDIKNITMSEERNRNAVTKLKSVYREVIKKYNANKDDYKETNNSIELQFENIDKLFSTFEKAVDNREYEELGKIVKALDDLIKNMQVVIDEAPTIIFMGKVVIPKKMSEVLNIYKKMSKDGYNLEYLNIDYNIEEANKKLGEILDRLNVLNLEDSIFELKTMLDYFESLFYDFDKEKISKKSYEESLKSISNRISKVFKVIKNIYFELGNLKDSYDLTDEEISVIDSIHKEFVQIRDDFKLLNDRTLTKVTPYSKLASDCELISIRLFKAEERLDNTLSGLSSLKEDELRAREQLIEIKSILKQSKFKIKEYKLPIIPKYYYVELKEAVDSIKEVTKELEKKPISIKTLNTRVDTARDLVFKLHNTSNEIVKTALMAELAIVYGNRYRSSIKEVEVGLIKAEKDFYKGNYKNSLEVVLNSLNIVEPGIHNKLLNAYENR